MAHGKHWTEIDLARALQALPLHVVGNALRGWVLDTEISRSRQLERAIELQEAFRSAFDELKFELEMHLYDRTLPWPFPPDLYEMRVTQIREPALSGSELVMRLIWVGTILKPPPIWDIIRP